MQLLRSIPGLCLALFATASIASAQNVITGGAGNTNLPGTMGPDVINDPPGNDSDTMDDDGGFGGDGQTDYLDSTDGDNNDSMSGGPEDHFRGDPGDWVRIEDGNGDPLWQGPFSEYQKIKRMIRWVKNMLNPSLRKPPHDMPTWFDQWMDSLASVRTQLGSVAVNEVIDLDDYFPVSDEEFTPCDNCWAPDEFWSWMPYSSDESGTSFVLTADEFFVLREDVDALLVHLIEVVEQAQSEH